MRKRIIRYAQVALSVVGSAILLFSCSGETQDAKSSAEEAMMTEYSENMSIVMTENGRKSYHFETPLIEGYNLARDPYREFRKGIKITTYTNDSLAAEDAVLTANYAIYYENRRLWEAKGDVVVIKADGKQLYTSQLFWNQATKKIYSNVDSKIVQNNGRDVFIGEGFESDEEFKDWRFRRMKGRMEVEVKPQNDSLAADSTTVRETPRTTDRADEKAADGSLRAKRAEDSRPAARPQVDGRSGAERRSTPVEGGAKPASGQKRPAARSASKYGSAAAASGVEAPAQQRNIPTLEGPRIDPLLTAPAAQGPNAAKESENKK